MHEDEEELAGGVSRVVRSGATVRRPTGPWTPRVHALLRHLRAAGFDGAPAVHGLTPEGEEILDFIPGEVAGGPLTGPAASLEALASAARLLRHYHDATASFVAGHLDGWRLPARAPAEVVCHGDFAPYNVVHDGPRAIAVIDLDFAHPGPRAWDLAYALYRWAPLTHPDNREGFGTPAAQAARAAAFCDAYGVAAADRAALPGATVDRLEALAAFILARAAAGDAAFARHAAEGHPQLYRRDAAHVRSQAERLRAALGGATP
jgi:hypothetical protein